MNAAEFTSGAGARNRTRDLRFTKPLLYQLSYTGTVRIIKRKGAGRADPFPSERATYFFARIMN